MLSLAVDQYQYIDSFYRIVAQWKISFELKRGSHASDISRGMAGYCG
jgi:hypothetical protein